MVKLHGLGSPPALCAECHMAYLRTSVFGELRAASLSVAALTLCPACFTQSISPGDRDASLGQAAVDGSTRPDQTSPDGRARVELDTPIPIGSALDDPQNDTPRTTDAGAPLARATDAGTTVTVETEAGAQTAPPTRLCEKRWKLPVISVPPPPMSTFRVGPRIEPVASTFAVASNEMGRVFVTGTYIDAVDFGVGPLPIREDPRTVPAGDPLHYGAFVLALEPDCSPRWSRGILPTGTLNAMGGEFIATAPDRDGVRVGVHGVDGWFKDSTVNLDQAMFASFDGLGNPGPRGAFSVQSSSSVGPWKLLPSGEALVNVYAQEPTAVPWLPGLPQPVRHWYNARFEVDGAVTRLPGSYGDDAFGTWTSSAGVTLGQNDSVIWAGSHLTDFELGGQTITGGGGPFAVALSLAADGSVAWQSLIRTYTSESPDFNAKSVQDAAGNTYLVATSNDDINYIPIDLLVRKIDPHGVTLWEKVGSSASGWVDVTLNELTGGIVLTFKSTARFDLAALHVEGIASYVLVELDAAGSYVRSREVGQPNDHVDSTAVNKLGEIVVAGHTDPDGGVYELFVDKIAP